MTKRRPKWQYQHAQPTPRILQLPSSSCSSRPRKNYHKSNINNGKVMMMMMMRKVNKLGVLFDEEREFRRGRVDDRVDGVDAEEVEEEKWRFQAEMLRAECNLLRIEREVAVKKMERRRVQVERLLRSAVQSLLSVSPCLSISIFACLEWFYFWVCLFAGKMLFLCLSVPV